MLNWKSLLILLIGALLTTAAWADGLSVTPNAVTLSPEASLPFSASSPVTWSVHEAGGGTITDGGVYTAPATPGTFHVLAVTQSTPLYVAVVAVTVKVPDTPAVSPDTTVTSDATPVPAPVVVQPMPAPVVVTPMPTPVVVQPAADFVIINDYPMISLRECGERFDAVIDYDTLHGGFSIIVGARVVRLVPYSDIAWIGDREYLLHAPVMVVDDVTYVPLHFICDAFDYDCTWSDSAHTHVIIVNRAIVERPRFELWIDLDFGRRPHIYRTHVDGHAYYQHYRVLPPPGPRPDGYANPGGAPPPLPRPVEHVNPAAASPASPRPSTHTGTATVQPPANRPATHSGSTSAPRPSGGATSPKTDSSSGKTGGEKTGSGSGKAPNPASAAPPGRPRS